MALELKDSSYLTVEEMKDWLNIQEANTTKDNKLTRLINVACDQVRQYIDRPVLTQEFVEWVDGNSSNVIVPTRSPVVEIVEVKIDFNRAFDAVTALQADNYVLRGLPSFKQITSGDDINLVIDGTDIVLRDDNNSAVIGRIFSGSVIQSVQLKYKAGYGETADDLPSDLVHATLMLVEYLYIISENRELNIRSKGTFNGQNYSRDTGMPKEISEILDNYKDFSLPAVAQPQRNTFKI